MSDEQTGGKGSGEQTEGEPKSNTSKVKDGFRDGLGVLSAFKDALEETIQEARERGDLSTDRAKEVLKETLDKAQSAAEGARDRLDRSNPDEMESMRSAVDGIKDRLSSLEESVFGAAKGNREGGRGSGAKSEESSTE